MSDARKYNLVILPHNRTTEIAENIDLLTAIVQAGVNIQSICGGKGVCRKCKIIVKEGKVTNKKRILLDENALKKGYTLACQTLPLSDLVIEIPIESQVQAEKIQTVKSSFYSPIDSPISFLQRYEPSEFNFSPFVNKYFLQLTTPSIENNISDYGRILSALKKYINMEDSNVEIDLDLLQILPKVLRQSGWEITVALFISNDRCKILQLQPRNTTKKLYGLAIDIGTTTVVASLIDLATTKVIETAATYNKQIQFGSDVISRMLHAEKENGLKELNTAVVDTVNELISNLCNKHHIDNNDVLALQFAGNTVMTHLMLNLPPENIRREPYLPVANTFPFFTAKELNINVNPKAIVSFLPNVASYVGGDIVAGVIASGMYNIKDLSLLIDLGTNGELVLGNSEWLISCACSAGPAFEGVGIECGMYAVEGAIQKIKLSQDGKIEYETIGNVVKPYGICGSGLIELIAELLKNKIITRDGRFVPAQELNDRTLLYKRIVHDDTLGEKFILVPKEETAVGKDIFITEEDISNILRSKGAIFHGIHTLLDYVGLQFDDVKNIFISGGFGTFLDIRKGILIGLFPDLPLERFKYIGNSSLAGARLCLLSQEARELAYKVAKKMTYIDLSSNAKFMNDYTAALFLPHTNLDLFPSVRRELGI